MLDEMYLPREWSYKKVVSYKNKVPVLLDTHKHFLSRSKIFVALAQNQLRSTRGVRINMAGTVGPG